MLLLSQILLVIASPFMGSFLGAVITRWSTGRPLYSGRAACDCGQVVLSARDMIPIASWAISRGRCRLCARRLGKLYPAVEIAALLIALWSIVRLPGNLVWTGAAFGWTLLVIAMIVWRQGKLPVPIVVGLGIAGLLFAGIGGWENAGQHLLSAVIGFALYFAVAQLDAYLGTQLDLQPFDAMLLAALGAWLGLEAFAGLLVLAVIMALLLIRVFIHTRSPHDHRLIAVCLCIAAWLAWLYMSKPLV